MSYGLYLSASGVLTNMHRQDVIANNLANASTAGFKRDLASFSQRLPESQEDPGGLGLSHELLDRLGGGIFVAPTQTDFRDGGLTRTNNTLDVALHGPGFFAVRQTDADGQQQVRLTRDGRFTLTTEGQLVTTTDGLPVLDGGLQPIYLNPLAAVTSINEQGRIVQDGAPVAQLRLAAVDDTRQLRPLGFGLYELPGELEADQQAPARVLQGWVESANVDPVREMVEMIETTRAITNNANLIRYHDLLMDRAVNALGRVA